SPLDEPLRGPGHLVRLAAEDLDEERALDRVGGEQLHRLLDAFENGAGVDEVGGAEPDAPDLSDREPEREVRVPGVRRAVEPRREPQCPDGQRLAVVWWWRRNLKVRVRHGITLQREGCRDTTSPG